MNLKKVMLLATMAVAAVAFAVPAAASAATHFTDNHKPITGTVTTELTGTIGFNTPGVGSYECNAHAKLSVGTTSATLKELKITTSECRGTGGLAHCKLNADSLAGEPTVTPSGEDASIEGVDIFNRFETGYPGTGETIETPCSLAPFVGGIHLEFEEITVTPDNPEAISTFAVSGEGVVNAVGVGVIAEAEAYGSLTVAEGQEGTISLSEVP